MYYTSGSECFSISLLTQVHKDLHYENQTKQWQLLIVTITYIINGLKLASYPSSFIGSDDHSAIPTLLFVYCY